MYNIVHEDKTIKRKLFSSFFSIQSILKLYKSKLEATYYRNNENILIIPFKKKSTKNDEEIHVK